MHRPPCYSNLTRMALCIALALLWTARPAHAVVPGLMGPLQALLQMLPQLFFMLMGVVASLFSVPHWRARLLQRPRVWGPVALALAVAVVAGGLYFSMGPPASVPGTAGPVAVPHSWTSFRGNAAGLGVLDGALLPSPAQVVWSHAGPAGASYDSSPAVVDGRVYIGAIIDAGLSSAGALDCLDSADGHLLWRSVTRYPVFSSPVVADNRVYCGEGLHTDNDSRMYCRDAGTGTAIWTLPTRGHIEFAPTLVGDKLIFCNGDEGVLCVEAASGKRVWQAAVGHTDSAPAVLDGRVFVGTAYGANSTICLDLATGQTRWSEKEDLPVWGHAAAVGDRVCFGLGNGDFNKSDRNPRGAVVCFDAASGRRLWRAPVPDSVQTAISISGLDVIFGCRDGLVYCLSLGDGSVRWQAWCGAPVLSSLCVEGDTIYVAGGDRAIRALARSDGTVRWKLQSMSGAAFDSSPVVAGGRLYVGALDTVLCLGAK